MKAKFFITMLAMVLCWSCASEEPVVNVPQNAPDYSGSRYLSPDEAVQCALNGFKDFGFERAESRTAEGADVHIYSNAVSRTSEGRDSLFYIVNMEDGGFAVVAADRRWDGNIVGISDSGYFDESNENLSFYMDYLGDLYGYPYQIEPGKTGVGLIDPITGEPRTSQESPYVIEWGYTTVPTEWGQENPYNYYCPKLTNSQRASISESYYNRIGGRCVVGCVPLAIGQIFAYHRNLEHINGYTLDWDLMLEKSHIENIHPAGQQQVSRLLYGLGLATRVEYDLYTVTSIEKARQGCMMLGCHNVKISQEFEDVYANIKEEGPVAVFGFVKDTPFGHCWVADGFQKIQYKKLLHDNETVVVSREEYQVHFNWGWNGVSNGYFVTTAPYETYNGTYGNNVLYFMYDFI